MEQSRPKKRTRGASGGRRELEADELNDWREARLIAKHFPGTGLEYMVERMPLGEWWPCLVAALEAEELERRVAYYGEPQDYVPFWDPEGDLASAGEQAARSRVTEEILQFAGGRGLRGSVQQLAQIRPDKAQAVFVDAAGRVVDAEGKPIAVPEGTVVVDASGKRLETPTTKAEPQRGDGLQDILGMFGMG